MMVEELDDRFKLGKELAAAPHAHFHRSDHCQQGTTVRCVHCHGATESGLENVTT
jgi:hypothetical protein